MECVVCGGKDPDCKSCGGWGFERIYECPRKQITPDIWQLIELASFAEKGSFPILAGVLDQSASFMRGCRAVWNETSYWKAKNRAFE